MSRRNAVYAKHHQERFAAKTFPAKKILPVLPRLTFSAVRRKRRRNFTKPVILV